MEEKELRDFVFDILGDFIDPQSDIEIDKDRHGNFRVIIIRTRGIPKDIIRDEWYKAASGTKFESVMLFI